MDVYGMSAPECFPVDDLLDFSKDEIFYASNDQSTPSSDHNNYAWAPNHFIAHNPINQSAAFFTEHLCVPTLQSDDVAELEWLSNFVEDSFTDFPANDLSGTLNIRPETSFQSRSRSKRSRAASTYSQWISSPESDTGKTKANNIGRKRDISSSSFTGDRSPPLRRCTHCSSEKTPQWRTGPLGPKTLCNACGVRFKSGRLVPEYRPAASPTFVLTQHSNSHRKVMELRRQKEIVRRQNRHNFEVY